MKCQVRLFAAARQLARQEQLEIDIEQPATVSTLRQAIAEAYPALRALLPHCRFAIEMEYVLDEQVLHEGEEVACIPPVSGG